MGTDSQQLTSRSTTNQARDSLYLGLLYSLPLMLWVAGQLDPTPGGSGADVALRCAQILVLVQSIMLACVAPWYAWDSRWQDGLTGLLIVLLVPLPLVAVIWLTGAADASTLVLAQAGLVSLAALLLALGKLVAHAVPSGVFSAIAVTSLQVCAVAAAWILRHEWLAWFGL